MSKTTQDLISKTSKGAANLSKKLLGPQMEGTDRVWVIKTEVGKGVIVLPFDSQLGPDVLLEQFLDELRPRPQSVPQSLPAAEGEPDD